MFGSIQKHTKILCKFHQGLKLKNRHALGKVWLQFSTIYKMVQ